MIKGQPCKLVDLSTSQTGKHGHSKIHLIGIDIFTGKKFESVVVSTSKSEAPVVSRDEYQLVRPIFSTESIQAVCGGHVLMNIYF
jgi:translation initiation factor 5A